MQPGRLSLLQVRLLFSEGAEAHSATGWQVKCSGLETQRCEQEHSQATALHPLEHCPAPPSSTVPGPHPASSRATLRPLGASGNRWPSVLGSIRPQTPCLFLLLLFCLTTKNHFWFLSGKAAAKTRWSKMHRARPAAFIRLQNYQVFAKSPSAQHKQSKSEAGGLFKLVSLLWHITNRQKPLSATSAGCDICWYLWL